MCSILQSMFEVIMTFFAQHIKWYKMVKPNNIFFEYEEHIVIDEGNEHNHGYEVRQFYQ